MPAVSHTQREHSPFGASSIELLSYCPGAYKAQQKYPNETSEPAAEGTAAHELSEACMEPAVLTQNPEDILNASKFIGKTFNGFEVDKGMADAVNEYLGVIYSDWTEYGGTLHVEEKFDISDQIRPQMYGANDAALTDCSDGVLRVYDYKHGQGVAVEVKGNLQLRYYGIGAMYNLDLRGVKEIDICIAQPRSAHDDGPIRRERFSVIQMLEVEMQLGEIVDACLEDNAPRHPGKHCRDKFCRAQSGCGELESYCMAQAEAMFDENGFLDEEPVDVDTLNADQLGEKLKALPIIEGWCRAVRARVESLLNAGEAVQGWKLVAGRSNRFWKNAETAKQLLRAEGFQDSEFVETVEKFSSVAQAEKLVGKKRFKEIFSDVVEKPEGKPTLAPASDKRPAVASSAVSAFDGALELE